MLYPLMVIEVANAQIVSFH